MIVPSVAAFSASCSTEGTSAPPPAGNHGSIAALVMAGGGAAALAAAAVEVTTMADVPATSTAAVVRAVQRGGRPSRLGRAGSVLADIGCSLLPGSALASRRAE